MRLSLLAVNIAQAIAAIIEPVGFAISALEADAEHWAWEICATNQGQQIWCSVNAADLGEVYPLTEDQTPIWRSKRRAAYGEFLQELHRALSADSRFSAVRWFRDAGRPNAQEASSPIS
ncbi:MAG: hypothetical protein ACREH4_00560 [Vitreimonas sp.]